MSLAIVGQIMRILLTVVIASFLLPSVSAAQTQRSGPTGAPRVETYRSVAIDASGSLVITTSDQRTIVVPKEGEQSSFSAPIVSSAGTAVGAQAEFPNCCTSVRHPVTAGHLRQRKGPSVYRYPASDFPMALCGRRNPRGFRSGAGPFWLRDPLRAQRHSVGATD